MDYKIPLAESLRALGERARQLRLIRELSQAELAERAGVGVVTIHRFEKSGAGSIETLLRVATALDAEEPFESLFEAPAYTSIDDALARPAKTRQRASKHR
jgi:transcriptional regulator with XRE-family HTH domain